MYFGKSFSACAIENCCGGHEANTIILHTLCNCVIHEGKNEVNSSKSRRSNIYWERFYLLAIAFQFNCKQYYNNGGYWVIRFYIFFPFIIFSIQTAKNNYHEDKPHRLSLDVGDAVIISGECTNWYYGHKKM